MPGKYQYDVEIKSNVAKLLTEMKEVQDRLDTVEGKEYKIKLNVDEKKLASVISNLEKMLDSLGKGTGDFKQFENLSKELSNVVSEVQNLSKAFGKVDDSGAKTLLSSIQNIDRSLSELSQNILNVNKNMSNIGVNANGAVKQVENIGNSAAEAVRQVDKLADAQNKLGNKTNISLGGSSTTSADTEIKANSEVIASIEKKKQELASYELQLEETRYEIEKLSKAENEAYGFKKAYSNMNDKYINSRKESLYNSIFGTDKSKGQGSMKYQTMNLGGNVEKGYAAWREELERLGYTLSELRKTNIGVEADIIPIDGKAITNAEEFRKTLFGITSVPSDNIKVLNQQISELESKISSIKSEISSLESVSNNPKKDAFPDKDVSASVESATSSIKEENNVLEQNTQKAKENAEAKEKMANADKEVSNVNLSKYDNRLESYNKKTAGYDATIARFENGGWTSDEYIRNVNAVKEAVKKYQNILADLKTHPELVTDEGLNKLNEQEKLIKQNIAAVQNMSAAEKGYSLLSGQKAMDKINSILKENSAMSKEAKNQIRAWYNEIASGNPRKNLTQILGEVQKIVNAEADAGRAGKSMMDSIKEKAWYGVASAIGTYFGFNDVLRYGKEGIDTVRQLDTALTEMRKVSNESIQTLREYQKESFNTADAIATTGLQMQNSIADWQRLGYSISEANELAKNSNIYKNVGDMDISTATEHMVSSVQAWKSEFNDDAVKTSEEVMNRYNKIGNEFAISSADIGEAMETSAAALKAGGNDLNEALGIITAGNIIQQDASTTSSAMKILSLRIRGAKSDLESMGESTDDLADSTSKLREEIKGLTGVDIMADEDTFKSTAEIIKEIGAVWDQMTDVSQAATLEKLAGKNRASTVAGLIENYETIDKVIEAASNADNSALDENQKIIESIDGKVQQLQNRVQEFWYNAIDDSVVKDALSALTALVEGGTKLVDTFGLLPTILTSVGAALSIKNVGILKLY